MRMLLFIVTNTHTIITLLFCHFVSLTEIFIVFELIVLVLQPTTLLF